MPRYRRRERLTERVAARKAGHRDPDEGPPKRWPRLLSQFGLALSFIALFLLAYEALQAVDGDWNIERMGLYAGIFIGGRLLKSAIDTAKPYL